MFPVKRISSQQPQDIITGEAGSTLLEMKPWCVSLAKHAGFVSWAQSPILHSEGHLPGLPSCQAMCGCKGWMGETKKGYLLRKIMLVFYSGDKFSVCRKLSLIYIKKWTLNRLKYNE